MECTCQQTLFDHKRTINTSFHTKQEFKNNINNKNKQTNKTPCYLQASNEPIPQVFPTQQKAYTKMALFFMPTGDCGV